jgi:DNA mismatch repair protein MutL
MGRIHQLPPELANQIAAGEVVERPASVIKELVENSIDAGARRITIAVELGGKKLIRVEDDGDGMDPDDARLAIERHATSKIRRADDLARIATLGFRGEALPSIASVSHLILRTRVRGATSGTEIRVNGGAVASVTEVGMPEGTSIEVGDLFYNLPARRKFLKSDAAESAQVSRIVTQLALGYPEIGFTLVSSGRKVLQCPPVASLRDRLYQLYGDRGDLIDVKRDSGDVKVVGFVAALAEQGPTRGPQNVYINRRVVKDRTIAHAIIDAYSVASIKERSPEVHLFIEMPHEAVDVNVHPTKAEVRSAAVPRPSCSWKRRRDSNGRHRPCRFRMRIHRRFPVDGRQHPPRLSHLRRHRSHPSRLSRLSHRRPKVRSHRPSDQWCLSDSSGTRSSLLSMRRASRSSTSTLRTSGCCSSESPNG